MLQNAAQANPVFTVITLILAVLSITGTLLQYFLSSSTKAREPFLTEQLKLYLEISQVVAVIADSVSPDSDERSAAKRRFRQLYLGQLALVESAEVESAVVAFDNALDNVSKHELQQLALNISHACRHSISASWKLSLAVLAGKNEHKRHSSDRD